MNMVLDPSSPLPLHRQATARLEELIREPRHQAGELLPDELSLAKDLGISRGTVRQAIDQLVRQGLIERRRGIGTRVVPAHERRIQHDLGAWASFAREMEEQGVSMRILRSGVGIEAADEVLAASLGLDAGTPVVRLERLRGDARGPVARFVSWLHPRLGLDPGQDWSRPLYTIIRAAGGPSPRTSDEELSVEDADAGLAADLDIAAESAVLVRRRVVRDGDGAVIEVATNHYRRDRFVLRQTLEVRS